MPDLIQHVRSLGLVVFFYTYGEPLRLRHQGRADYVFPKLVEAEKVIGYEFGGLEDQHRRRLGPCARWAAARW